MASLKFLLGMLPETAKFEQRVNQLRKDYEAFKAIENSNDLKRYEELDKEVNSSQFRMKVKEIKSQKYKNSDEFLKEMHFQSLGNSKLVKAYLNLLDSDRLSEYESFSKSKDLKRYNELKEYILSDAFIKEKASLSSSEFKKSEAGLKEQEYKEISNSHEIKNYFKFDNSKEYREYLHAKESADLRKYLELESIINSDAFIERKNYLHLSPKDKYESSEEYRKVQEYELLKSSEQLIWFFKTKKRYPFAYVEQWESSFEDNFKEHKLDPGKWISRYLTGDKTFKRNYVLGDDRHAFTDGKNLEFYDKKLRIITKREPAKALVWNPEIGFYEKEFDYTSDMIISGHSFRQKYGLIEAKVKIAHSGVTQSLSLRADGILPHIDIFKYEKSRLFSGSYWKNGSSDAFSKTVSRTSGSKYTKGYFIYSLEWLPGKLTWRINGEVFKVQTLDLPEEPLYLMFNSSLKEVSSFEGIPSALEIDWVRVYRLKDTK